MNKGIKKIKKIIFLAILICFAGIGMGQNEIGKSNNVSIFGLTIPEVPEVFLPGIVSTKAHEYSITYSADKSMIYFTRMAGNLSYIHCVDISDKEPQSKITDFSGVYNDYDQNLSPCGDILYFTSDRPRTYDSFVGDIYAINLKQGNKSDARKIRKVFKST